MVTEKVEALLEKSGVNDEVIKQIMPSSKRCSKKIRKVLRLKSNLTTVKQPSSHQEFISTAMVNNKNSLSWCRRRDGRCFGQRQNVADEKLKAVEEAKLQLQKSVEALQMQKHSMNAQQQMLEAQMR